MSLSPSIVRRVKQLRAQSIYPMPITTAVEIARYEAKDYRESEYPFLADLDDYGHDSVSGNVGPFKVTVTLSPDEYSHLGDDDVTGTFHERTRGYYGDDEHDKPDPNAVRCSYAGYNGPRNVYWYIPGKATLDLRDYYIKEDRKSRSLIEDIVRETIKRDMRDDADRSYYNLDVTVEAAGEEVGRSSLGGIDVLSDGNSGASYLCDTACELIDEALAEAQESLPKAAARAEEHAAQIRALIAGGH